MAILFNNPGENRDEWIEALKDLLPNMPIYASSCPCTNLEEIKYAVVWNHPPGDLQRYPNLRAVLNLGAGTDYLDADNDLPKVPIVRLLDPVVDINMAQYVLYWVMHFRCGYERYRLKQINKDWSRFRSPQVSDFRVSVLGLGMIGQFIAKHIADSGFDTKGWNRSERSIENISTHTGEKELNAMLAETDVLVNCLPLNESTRKFIGHRIFNNMPKGGYFINVSRGGVVNDNELIEVLDNKHLEAAVLDAFTVEPLPADSAYWTHSKVFVTPHVSGATYPTTTAKVVADNIHRLERGEQPFPIYPQFPYKE